MKLNILMLSLDKIQIIKLKKFIQITLGAV